MTEQDFRIIRKTHKILPCPVEAHNVEAQEGLLQLEHAGDRGRRIRGAVRQIPKFHSRAFYQ